MTGDTDTGDMTVTAVVALYIVQTLDLGDIIKKVSHRPSKLNVSKPSF